MTTKTVRDGRTIYVESTKSNAFIKWDLKKTPASLDKYWWRPDGVWCEDAKDIVYAFGDLLGGRDGPKYMQAMAKKMRSAIHAEARKGGAS